MPSPKKKSEATGTVYCLHFSRKYKHAGHYIGWTQDLEGRLEEHRKGQGARLLQVIQAAGIDWELARIWNEKTRKFERQLKKRCFGLIAEICPLCQVQGEIHAHPLRPLDVPRRSA